MSQPPEPPLDSRSQPAEAAGSATVAVGQQEVEDLRSAAQRALRASGVVELFAEIDPGPYGKTIDGLRLLQALEIGVACVLATRRAVVGRIGADRRTGLAAGALTAEEERFASLIATHVGLKEALAGCACPADRLPPAERHLSLDEYRELMTRPEAGLISGLLGDFAGYLRFYRKKADPGVRLEGADRLLACVASYLALASATAARLGDDGEHAATLTALCELGLDINGASYRGFERQSALPVEEESGLMAVAPEDIVGNQEPLAAGLALARAVAGFDLERGANPRLIRNPVLFMLGTPGCGKTVTAHAIGNYFLDLCRRHRVPARFRIIRRTDWASHYQNKSANELLRIFRQEIFEFPGVAGVYWPDIDTAFAARDEPGIRAEEKAVLGTLFGLLDGTVGPRNGKWFMIADANHLTMDEAALSRLTQDPHYARGPQSADDFIEMLRDKKLAKVREHLAIDDDDWRAFGDRCVGEKLSGRAVDNIAGKILTDMDNVEVDDSYFSLGFEAKVATLAARRGELDAKTLHELLDRYVRFEREAEERAQRERFERRVTEIREQLAARIAAVGGDPA